MAAESLRIFDPRRNFQLQGFTGRAATTTIHDASATGVSVSGIFQAAEDFAVLGFYNAYDYFNHLRQKHLPRTDLSGLILEFDIEYEPRARRVLLGRSDEGVRELERAVKLDPLSPAFRADLGEVLRFSRRYDEAIENYRKAIQIDAKFWLAYLLLAAASANKGDFQTAYEAIEKGRAVEPDTLFSVVEAQILARGGQMERARRLARQLERLAAQGALVPAAIMAQAYAALGDKDRAFEWLEKSYQGREAFMPSLKMDPGFDPLRSDPRFSDLLRRMRFPEQSGSA